MKLLIKLSLWSLAFVPLIVISTTFFPFIFGKTILIRTAIFLASAVFAIHFFADFDFRKEVGHKIKLALKNPLAISLLVFMAIVVISTATAVFPYRAFFGDIERGEGLLGMLTFFAFFVYSYLVFEKKDWLMFFKLNLISGFILFIKEFVEYNQGIARPGSFTGNPEFIAGYFLFVLFCALLVFKDAIKDFLWKYFAVMMAVFAIVGIFISQTRGTMLGLVGGALALIVYGIVYGKQHKVFDKVNIRIASIIFLLGLVGFAGLFISTKSSPVWQKIPGLGRVAQITTSDTTFKTRLISLGISKRAVSESGTERFLFGYGLENFSVAYNKYYNPEYFRYEHTWFDRAHNKLMDVVVMNGVLGLLAYLAVWTSLVWLVFRRKHFSFELMAVFLFGAAYFVHLLTVFDQISTYIPFFGVLAYLVFLTTEKEDDNKKDNKNVHKKTANISNADQVSLVLFGATSLFFLWGLVAWVIVPYSQMSEYLSLISSGNLGAISQNIDNTFEPYTYSQQDMRMHFLLTMGSYYGKGKEVNDLFIKALNRMDELVQKEPYSPRFLLQIGNAYNIKGKIDNNPQDLAKAEYYQRKALELAPKRQDVIYALAMNLVEQKRNREALELMKKSLADDNQVPETNYYYGIVLYAQGPVYFAESLEYMEKALNKPEFLATAPKGVSVIYQTMAKYFYEKGDMENFIKIIKREKLLMPDKSSDFDRMLELLNQGKWPNINFN